MMAFK